MNSLRGARGLLRMFSSAVISQALLSAASLIVGLILIRRSTDLQYGYYILAVNSLMLLTSLQNSFFLPALVNRLARLDRSGRSDTVGGFFRVQRSILPFASAGVAAITCVLWAAGVLDVHSAPLILAVTGTALLTLNREFFRMTLLAYRRPLDVLKSDMIYVVVLIPAVLLATWSPVPALSAILGIGAAALIGGLLLAKALRRHEPWNIAGDPGILRRIAPLALWSTAGATIHWSFSQGYAYLVAATLDVSAVAAVAATRLLMMPINLLSTGLGALLLPMAAAWMAAHGAPTVLRRLSLMSAAMAVLALCYFAVLWPFRDWVFTNLMKKSFAERDPLLLLWFAAFLAMIVRDQMIFLLVVRTRFRVLTAITAASAALSLSVSFWGIRHFGQIGAPLGVLLGELVSVAGIVILSVRETETTRMVTA